MNLGGSGKNFNAEDVARCQTPEAMQEYIDNHDPTKALANAILARAMTPKGAKLWWDRGHPMFNGLSPQQVWSRNARIVLQACLATLDQGCS